MGAIGFGCFVGSSGADELAEGNGGYLRRQLVFSVLAIFVTLAVSVPSYRVLCRWSYALFAATIVLLVAVFFFPLTNGAHRWIPLGPINLQPSEFAKIAFVLAMAQYLMYRENYRRLRGLVAPLLITMIPVLLILKEPDLGMAIVFLPVLFVMLIAAGRGARTWRACWRSACCCCLFYGCK